MKSPKSLYSRLALITSVTLVVGYFVVYAAWTGILDSEIAPSATITSTLMTKIKNNLEYLSGGLANFGFSAGNVGIGTTIPTEKLEVVGNVKVSGTIVRTCPTGMTKVVDYCIDDTAVTDVAGEDQKMAMSRCAGQNKHLCSFGELKTAWIVNVGLICPGGVGRYSTSEGFIYNSTWQMLIFDCTNCPLTTNACMGSDLISTDTADKSRCCLNP